MQESAIPFNACTYTIQPAHQKKFKKPIHTHTCHLMIGESLQKLSAATSNRLPSLPTPRNTEKKKKSITKSSSSPSLLTPLFLLHPLPSSAAHLFPLSNQSAPSSPMAANRWLRPEVSLFGIFVYIDLQIWCFLFYYSDGIFWLMLYKWVFV